MTQFDKIASDYIKGIEKRVYRNYLVYPTFEKVLGNIKGKTVLDMACGNGYSSRFIKNLGAKKVIGTDGFVAESLFVA